jgi:Cu/Ag efflux pump CusA
MFLLLQALFRSWRLALLLFATLPLALAGGALAAYGTGDAITLGSLIGFLAVLGIATRSGSLLVTTFQRLEEDEGMTFGPGLVLQGARERVAPIVISALAAGLALVPLLATGSIAGQEIAHPIAVIVLAGIATSTLVTLFVTPVLYLRSRGGS